MAPQKSNNDKKKEAEAAGRAPKCVLHRSTRLARDNAAHSFSSQHGRAQWPDMPCGAVSSRQHRPFPSPHRKTKQAENAGKSATQKKAEQKANKAAKNEKKSFG